MNPDKLADKVAREWWIKGEADGRNISNHIPIYCAVEEQPQNPGWTHVIEHSAYLAEVEKVRSLTESLILAKKQRDGFEVKVNMLSEALRAIAENAPVEAMKSWRIESLINILQLDGDLAKEALEKVKERK